MQGETSGLVVLLAYLSGGRPVSHLAYACNTRRSHPLHPCRPAVVLEGTRPLLQEVQALCSPVC